MYEMTRNVTCEENDVIVIEKEIFFRCSMRMSRKIFSPEISSAIQSHNAEDFFVFQSFYQSKRLKNERRKNVEMCVFSSVKSSRDNPMKVEISCKDYLSILINARIAEVSRHVQFTIRECLCLVSNVLSSAHADEKQNAINNRLEHPI